MPLEIRELVIRTSVRINSQQGYEIERDDDGNLSEAEQAAIIAACVDQVLDTLQMRAER